MGGASSKSASSKSAEPEKEVLEVVNIHNDTNQEIVVREANRTVDGPIRCKIAAKSKTTTPRSVPDGTYVRFVVLVGNTPISYIYPPDLYENHTIAICEEGGEYKLVKSPIAH